MNNSKQESKNELKVISKIEVNTKPKGYDETVARNPAQLGYVHKALDKLIAELNTKFVPELDDKFNNLIDTIGDINKQGSLKQQLKLLRDEVDGLTSPKKEIDPNNEDDWEAPTHFDIL